MRLIRPCLIAGTSLLLLLPPVHSLQGGCLPPPGSGGSPPGSGGAPGTPGRPALPGGPATSPPATSPGAPSARPPGSGSGTPGTPGPASPGPSRPGSPYAGPASSPGAGPAGSPVGSAPASPAAPAARPQTPSSPEVASIGPDLSSWVYWWSFNRDAYLDLNRARWSGSAVRTFDDGSFATASVGEGRTPFRPSPKTTFGRVTPALREVLSDASQPDLQIQALLALAKVGENPERAQGEPRHSELIRAHLADGNQGVAEAATLALGVLATPESAFLLADLLDETPLGQAAVGGSSVGSRQRAYSAYAMGLVAERTSREDVRRYIAHRLIGSLQGDAGEHRDIAVACISGLGLCPLTIRTTPSTSRGLHGRHAQLRALLDVFSNERGDDLVRTHAATALARLCEGLMDEDPMRSEVTRELVRTISPRSKAAKSIVHASTLALGELGDADAGGDDDLVRTMLLSAADRTGDPQLRQFAMVSLAKNGARNGDGSEGARAGEAKTRAFLQQRLTRGRTTIRPWAALALGVLERGLHDRGELGCSDTNRALRLALEDAKSQEERGAIAVAMGLVRDPEACDMLLDLLGDTSDDAQRSLYALALGMIGEARCSEELSTLVEDSVSRPGLLREGSIALALMGRKDTVPDLVTTLSESKAFASQAACTAALGFIGDQRAVHPLLAALRDETLTTAARAQAAAALGRVCESRELPWSSHYAESVNYLGSTETLTNGYATGVLDIL